MTMISVLWKVKRRLRNRHEIWYLVLATLVSSKLYDTGQAKGTRSFCEWMRLGGANNGTGRTGTVGVQTETLKRLHLASIFGGNYVIMKRFMV